MRILLIDFSSNSLGESGSTLSLTTVSVDVFRIIDPKAEAELVGRIINGDQNAEEELFERYRRGVTIIINQALGGRAAAADLCQETFRITLQKIRRGELLEPAKLPAFIWSVAHNLVIDYFRKLRTDTHTDLEEARQVSDTGPNQLDQLLQRERAEIIRSLLDELSERDRQVLHRFYIAEDDKKEICADLGLTSLQFNLVLFRARKQYKKLFEKRVAGKL